VIPAVGSTTLTVTDGTRMLTASVLYPATRPGIGVAALVRGHPWPLIVFSPGFDIVPEAYDGLVDQWVTAGFVVAVAEYPGTAPDAPGGLDEADIVDHPADLRAVIDDTLAQSATPGSVLAGTTDPNRIGVAGHSDGGDVTDAVVSDSCCRDPRIRAAAVLSGAELSSFGGSYGPPGVPLLVVQGDADQVNPPGCSQQIYDLAGSPRFYLDLLGSGHRAPYLAAGPYQATPAQATAYQLAVDRVTILFWHTYLTGDAGALAALHHGAGLGPDANLNVGAAQTVTGSCPGAPS
jgi:predicted dienelactone hydrolase